jgi:type I restriction enzyme, S subunit
MGKGFQMVPLGELLTSVNRPESTILEKQYSILGAHWYAHGLYIKDVKLGSEIQADRVYRVEEGDFVYNRLFAWKGSFALALKADHGCYVSNEFPCFKVKENKIDGQYLWKYFSRSSAWNEALGLSSGGTPTSRNRLKEEQQRIVARIEELAARIEEARGLRREALAAMKEVFASILAILVDPYSDSWKRQTVSNVILSIDAGWSPQCEDCPASYDEWGVLKTTAVQWGGFRPHENKALPEMFTPRPELSISVGDVLVTRAGPRKRVGVVASVPETRKYLMISDKLIRLKPDLSKIEPQFLAISLSTSFSQEYLVKRKTGLAEAQVNISQAILLSTPIAYPSLTEQKRIITYLNDVKAKIESLKQLQTETSAELDALLPSILDKAFKGEL